MQELFSKIKLCTENVDSPSIVLKGESVKWVGVSEETSLILMPLWRAVIDTYGDEDSKYVVGLHRDAVRNM
jgi:hypothetical protein